MRTPTRSYLRLVLGLVMPLCCAAAVNPPYTIETVAGSSVVGDGGPATQAALGDAQGICIDRSGNVYIADASDHRVRKISPAGLITTLAGMGLPGLRGDGGPASAAMLNLPYGVTADPFGNIFIADLGNNRIRKVAPDGTITTVLGGSSADPLLQPRNVLADVTGQIYVSEFSGHRVRKLAPDGTWVLIAGTGTAGPEGDGGVATLARLNSPAGLALDSFGNLYVADSGNHKVRKISGGRIAAVLGTGTAGAGTPNQLSSPTSVVLDAGGNLYVADAGNRRIRKLTSTGVISTLATAARDLALDAAGNLLIANGSNASEILANGATVALAGDGSFLFRGDGGAAGSARLNHPAGVAVDANGALWISDQGNNRLRMVNPAGKISTVTADLVAPSALALNAASTLLIADTGEHRIKQLTAGSIALRTLAGTGISGFNGDGIVANSSLLFSPGAVAWGPDGTVYLADTFNHRVRQLTAGGILKSVAGNGARGWNGDGSAIAAQLDTPGALCIDRAMNLYIADTGNNRIRKVTADGMIATVLGPDQVKQPGGLAVDASGVVWIADTGNNRVLALEPNGKLTSIAGLGSPGFSGDSGAALSAQLQGPLGVAVDVNQGVVYIADSGNNRVRRLIPAAAPIVEAARGELTVMNAATLQKGPVAPGSIVSVFGTSIGPADAVTGSLQSPGILASQVAGTQVTFDGVPGALLFAQGGQVNVQVPFEMAGRDTAQVDSYFEGTPTGRANIVIATSAPGLFTMAAAAGSAVVLDQDGTLNSESNAAAQNSIITLYATGAGQTSPAGFTGKLADTPLPRPILAVGLTIGGIPADVLYAGDAPGFAGLMQINARLRCGPGLQPVVLQIGSAVSQPGITVAVR